MTSLPQISRNEQREIEKTLVFRGFRARSACAQAVLQDPARKKTLTEPREGRRRMGNPEGKPKMHILKKVNRSCSIQAFKGRKRQSIMVMDHAGKGVCP